MPVIGSQSLGRNNIAERDYLKSVGDLNRVAVNSTRTFIDGPGTGFIETLGGADNDMIAYHLFQKVDLDDPGARGRLRITITPDEVDVNEQDWFAGLSSGLSTATGTISNTVEQLTSGDHIGLFKKANGLSVFYIAAANATHTAAVDTGVDVVDNTEYRIEIRWQAGAQGIDVQFLMNDVQVAAVTNVAYTDFDSLFAGFAMKTDDGNAEIIKVTEFLCGNVHR